LFVWLVVDQSFKKKDGYTRRIAGSRFGFCCQQKVTRWSQTKNTRSSHTCWKVHWGWRWDFRTLLWTV